MKSKHKRELVSYIADSHQRCEAYSLERKRQGPKLFVDEKPLNDLFGRYKEFTKIASPILENMANLIGNEEFILLLCDKDARILQLFGQEKAILDVAKKGIQQGVLLGISRNTMYLKMKTFFTQNNKKQHTIYDK